MLCKCTFFFDVEIGLLLDDEIPVVLLLFFLIQIQSIQSVQNMKYRITELRIMI